MSKLAARRARRARAPVMDRTLAIACGLDAGNRSMRAAGRTVWNADDAAAASAELARRRALIDPEAS